MSDNATTRLPLDGNGNAIPTGARAVTGTATLASGTGTDDIVIPKGALTITMWSTVAWGFAGIGTAAGTEVDVPANTMLRLGCTDADGSTVKAFVDQGSGGAGTLYWIAQMGA